jgi:hypothetical protein
VTADDDPLWMKDLRDKEVRDELDRRHPERIKLRPTDVSGLSEAFDAVQSMWEPTIDRARRLPPSKLHQRVNREYSFVETFRHLLFAWDAWLPRTVLRVPDGYHDWALPPENVPGERLRDLPADAGGGVMWSMGDGWSSSDAAPDLDPVLDVRAERFAHVREYLAVAAPDDLKSIVSAPPWASPRDVSVLFCFRVILNEEWWHHQFAVRDLAVVERA